MRFAGAVYAVRSYHNPGSFHHFFEAFLAILKDDHGGLVPFLQYDIHDGSDGVTAALCSDSGYALAYDRGVVAPDRGYDHVLPSWSCPSLLDTFMLGL